MSQTWKDNCIKLYKGYENSFKEVLISKIDINQELMVLEAYKFAGSFVELKKILQVPSDATLIPKQYQKLCVCLNVEKENNNNLNIEEAILAVFAQHPQFTKDVDINFDGLGLSNSKLRKEYEYLKSLPGYSVEDMSKLWIMHIYPVTLYDALKFDSHVANTVIGK